MTGWIDTKNPCVFTLTTKYVDISKGGKVLWYSDEKGTKEISPPDFIPTVVNCNVTPVTVTFRCTKSTCDWDFYFRVMIDGTVSHNIGKIDTGACIH